MFVTPRLVHIDLVHICELQEIYFSYILLPAAPEKIGRTGKSRSKEKRRKIP